MTTTNQNFYNTNEYLEIKKQNPTLVSLIWNTNIMWEFEKRERILLLPEMTEQQKKYLYDLLEKNRQEILNKLNKYFKKDLEKKV